MQSVLWHVGNRAGHDSSREKIYESKEEEKTVRIIPHRSKLHSVTAGYNALLCKIVVFPEDRGEWVVNDIIEMPIEYQVRFYFRLGYVPRDIIEFHIASFLLCLMFPTASNLSFKLGLEKETHFVHSCLFGVDLKMENQKLLYLLLSKRKENVYHEEVFEGTIFLSTSLTAKLAKMMWLPTWKETTDGTTILFLLEFLPAGLGDRQTRAKLFG
ncbi:hypothetical protein WN51_06303 [Melipona quadrifasciata]|uniref:Uncharacterized protein n=1 Tax=Melipona quadrifasciata TaxID=166423 RepID=A0A0M8ZQN2_9HYME|nr:hypothetical protein WN51_06303 [Melipona quadrifasciata]